MTYMLILVIGLAILLALALVIASYLRRSGIQAKANAALKAAETMVDSVRKDLGQ